jgi:hypothetical protein
MDARGTCNGDAKGILYAIVVPMCGKMSEILLLGRLPTMLEPGCKVDTACSTYMHAWYRVRN